jgi:hypothetical protein
MASPPKTPTQRQQVEAVLLREGQLSAHDATYRMGITRLASIVFNLKRDGWEIRTQDNGQGMLASYVLVSAPDTAGPRASTPLTLWPGDGD